MLARIEDVDHPYVLILDEVDQLEDKGLLRKLYPIPQLTMVLIANRKREVLSTLDERLQSRLRSSELVRFDRYTDDELVALLDDRIGWGLSQDAITRTQIERIAEAAAGNARDAISILRSAARNADHDGAARIREGDVTAAIPAARQEIQRKTVEKLGDDQRAVFEIVTEAGELSPNEIYDRYTDRVAEPKTRRTVRTYLRKLADYDLIRGHGDGPSRRYEAVKPE